MNETETCKARRSAFSATKTNVWRTKMSWLVLLLCFKSMWAFRSRCLVQWLGWIWCMLIGSFAVESEHLHVLTMIALRECASNRNEFHYGGETILMSMIKRNFKSPEIACGLMAFSQLLDAFIDRQIKARAKKDSESCLFIFKFRLTIQSSSILQPNRSRWLKITRLPPPFARQNENLP